MNSINIATKTPTSPAIVEDIDITNTMSSRAMSSDGANSNASGLSGISSFFSGISIYKIIAIIIILAFLGFNAFHYLANVTDEATSFVDYLTKDIRKVFNYLIGQPAKDTVVSSGEGTKKVISKTADTLNTGIDNVQNIVEPREHEKEYKSATNQLSEASQNRRRLKKVEDDHSDSQIQGHEGKGYCYVGTDREFRTCVQVNNADECLSGDIFATRQLCINPSLRE